MLRNHESGTNKTFVLRPWLSEQVHVVQVRKRSFLFPSRKPTDSGNMFKYIFPLVLIVSLVLNFLSDGIKKVCNFH